ncbi:Cell division protein FtsZ [Patescibacteria group bacterium]|nr:Cell division protein FtsZ [Patescibacteria group bacterium]
MLVKPQAALSAKIKVVGVGGGGGNALNTMINEYNIQDVEFIAINTDAQALMHSKADIKLRIGEQITRGLGSGGNPIIGRKAAEESVDLVHENLAGADMVFITAGMGGGTGTGASPIVAGIAKNLGALTVGVVTKPFHFEMKRRMDSALKGIEELREKVDTLIVVPNQRLLDTLEKNVPFLDAMKKADDILAQAVKSIANLITQTGLINVDFADVRSVMDNGGTALMGIGAAAGENRAAEASKMAIESPLLEVSIDGAKGVLFNVVGGRDLSMTEISEAAEIVKEKINPDAIFIFGASIDPAYEDKFEVTVLATGFESDYLTSEALNAALTGGLPSVNQPTKQAEQKPLSSGGLLGSLSRPKPQSQAEDDEDLDSLPSFLRRRKREDED